MHRSRQQSGAAEILEAFGLQGRHDLMGSLEGKSGRFESSTALVTRQRSISLWARTRVLLI